MSHIRRTHSQTYGDQQNRQEDPNSTTNIILPTLKQMIRQTTLQISQKRDMKQSRNPITKIKNTIKKSMRRQNLECNICKEKYQVADIIRLTQNCQHNFCKSCIDQYLAYKINAGQQINCPEDTCKASFSKDSNIYRQLPADLKKKYQKTQKFLHMMKNPNLKQCHQPNCEGCFDISVTPCICTLCKMSYCPKCSYKFHDGDCQDYQVQFLQNNFKFRRCEKCKNVVQKNQGCNHITCRCGYNFCYLCGADWNTDPCRFGNPPAPPRPERHCCVELWIWTFKLFLIIFYLGIAIPIYTVVSVLLFAGYLVVSVLVGGIKLFIDADCELPFKIILFPLILAGGVFWYFFDELQTLCDSFGRVTEFFLSPVEVVCEACED